MNFTLFVYLIIAIIVVNDLYMTYLFFSIKRNIKKIEKKPPLCNLVLKRLPPDYLPLRNEMESVTGTDEYDCLPRKIIEPKKIEKGMGTGSESIG